MKIKTLLAATLLMPTLALAETKSINKSGVPHPLYARMGLGISVPADLTVSETNTSGSVFISKEKPKNSFAFDIGLGYVFNEYYRTELALGYRSFQTDNVTLQTRSQFGFGVFHRITYRDVKMETTYGMLNGYFDLHNNTKLTPYLMAGVGMGGTKFSGPEGYDIFADRRVRVETKTVSNFVWNAGAGVRLSASSQLDIELAYRFMNLGRYSSKTNDGGNFKTKHSIANEALVGLILKL